MSEAARSRRIEPAFEPPFGQSDARRPDADDPLAELARLVGHEDPFRDVFKAEPRPAAPQAPAEDRWHTHGAADYADDHHPAPPAGHDDRWEEPSAEAYEAGYADSIPAEEQWDGQEHAAEFGHPENSAEYDAPPVIPDEWASRVSPNASAPALSDETAEGSKAPRRPLVVLFAVLALTGGGLAATFLARSGSSVAAYNGHGAPTIMASTTPAKIQQVDSSASSNAEDAESALLSRNAEKSGGAVKVVSSQEQPIDLAQLPKPVASADGTQEALPTVSQSPFPEPKKVKTFLVRADGSMIATPMAGSGGSAADAASTPTIAQLSGLDGVADAPAPAPTPRPATPKAAAHPSATPKAPPRGSLKTVADVAAEATNSTTQPQPAAAPKARPFETADVGASPSTGNFSLQLAASPSEADARMAFARLQKKYADLDGLKPTVKKADTGGKAIYRLRVGSMGQDEAKTLCAKLQADGGSCFVVRN